MGGRARTIPVTSRIRAPMIACLAMSPLARHVVLLQQRRQHDSAEILCWCFSLDQAVSPAVRNHPAGSAVDSAAHSGFRPTLNPVVNPPNFLGVDPVRRILRRGWRTRVGDSTDFAGECAAIRDSTVGFALATGATLMPCIPS